MGKEREEKVRGQRLQEGGMLSVQMQSRLWKLSHRHALIPHLL